MLLGRPRLMCCKAKQGHVTVGASRKKDGPSAFPVKAPTVPDDIFHSPCAGAVKEDKEKDKTGAIVTAKTGKYWPFTNLGVMEDGKAECWSHYLSTVFDKDVDEMLFNWLEKNATPPIYLEDSASRRFSAGWFEDSGLAASEIDYIEGCRRTGLPVNTKRYVNTFLRRGRLDDFTVYETMIYILAQGQEDVELFTIRLAPGTWRDNRWVARAIDDIRCRLGASVLGPFHVPLAHDGEEDSHLPFITPEAADMINVLVQAKGTKFLEYELIANQSHAEEFFAIRKMNLMLARGAAAIGQQDKCDLLDDDMRVILNKGTETIEKIAQELQQDPLARPDWFLAALLPNTQDLQSPVSSPMGPLVGGPTTAGAFSPAPCFNSLGAAAAAAPASLFHNMAAVHLAPFAAPTLSLRGPSAPLGYAAGYGAADAFTNTMGPWSGAAAATYNDYLPNMTAPQQTLMPPPPPRMPLPNYSPAATAAAAAAAEAAVAAAAAADNRNAAHIVMILAFPSPAAAAAAGDGSKRRSGGSSGSKRKRH